jgi:hypothetical protein
MRLNFQCLPVILLVSLPLYSAWCHFGVSKVALSLVIILVLRQALLFWTLSSKGKSTEDKFILKTIHASHYVEKVVENSCEISHNSDSDPFPRSDG